MKNKKLIKYLLFCCVCMLDMGYAAISAFEGSAKISWNVTETEMPISLLGADTTTENGEDVTIEILVNFKVEEYDKEYPQYAFLQHKGYGTALHTSLIKEHGPCPIHRLSFLKNILCEK